MVTARIIIQDEVNVKIANLSLDTRKALVKKFKYFDPAARYKPSYKLGRWDGSVSFFGIGGTTYVNMLDRVVEEVINCGYDIEVDDLREQVELKFESVDKNFWSHISWPVGHRFAGEPIMLRDDQVDVINVFLSNPQSLQELATGFGKTILTATMCKICEPYGRTLLIVPNKSLVEQTLEDFENVKLDVGVYYGDRKDVDKTHTICTWQSLNVLDRKTNGVDLDEEILTLSKLLRGVKTVIVDEVHMAKADVLKHLLTKHLSDVPIRWGVTGTIPKEEIDFMNIKNSLGDVVGKVSAKELQDAGVLSDCHVTILQTAEWKEFKSYPEELKFLVTDDLRMDFIAERLDEIGKTGNTLILVDRIETGKILKEKLSKLTGEDVAFVSGAVKSSRRKEEYDEISTNDCKIIIATYGVASVGINIPRIFNLVMIEPGKSFVRVIQSIGRGIRKAVDKDFVNIFDITSTCKFSKRHLTQRKKFYKDAKYKFTISKVSYLN